MKKNIPLLMSALIIAFSMTGCFGTPKPWVDAGFKNEKETDTQYWKKWENIGFSPIEAKGWKSLQITPNKALKYKRNGLTINEAIEWNNLDTLPKIAIQAKKNKFFLKDAKEWLKQNISVINAMEWKEAGFNSSNAGSLYKNNIYNLYTFNNWEKKGFNEIQMLEWGSIKFNTSGMYGKKEPSDFSIIEKLIKNNVSAKEYKVWFSINVTSIDRIIMLVKNKVPVERFKNIQKIVSFYDNAIAWSITSADLNLIRKFKKLNITDIKNLNKLNDIISSCPKGIEKNNLNSFTPFATEGKCFNYVGKIDAIKDKKTLYVKEFLGCNSGISFSDKSGCNYGDVKWGNRISILSFENSIPSSLTVESTYSEIVKSDGNRKHFIFGNTDRNTDLIYPVSNK